MRRGTPDRSSSAGSMCTFADNKALWRVELSRPGCSKNKYELSECRAGGRRRGQVIGTACISGSGRYKYGDRSSSALSSLLDAVEVSRSEAHAEVRQGLGCLEMAKVFCCPLATKQQRLQHTSDLHASSKHRRRKDQHGDTPRKRTECRDSTSEFLWACAQGKRNVFERIG